MQKLYSVGMAKLCREKKKEIKNVFYQGERMTAFFCENDKGRFVIAGQARKCMTGSVGFGNRQRAPKIKTLYDIYYRKMFKSTEEGNTFYKMLNSDHVIHF